MTAVELGSEIKDGHFTFSFVRNPWDRLVSMWQYRIQTHQIGEVEFSEWLQRFPFGCDRYHFQQVDWLTFGGRAYEPDFLGRFETLEADFVRLWERIKPNTPAPELPHLKRGSRGDYREYYTDATRALAASMFEDDIKRFCYEF